MMLEEGPGATTAVRMTAQAMPARIVVTGATGFTGGFVVRELLGRFPEARLRCLVRPQSDISQVSRPSVELARADLRDTASLRAAFAGVDTLVHVASLGLDWVEPLIHTARLSGISRGIFISTTAIFTRLPVSSRPVRLRAEALVRDSGLAWTILRPTMIYGTPRDRNIARLIRFVMRSPVIPIVAPDALQQPVHVEDVAAAVAAALASPATVGSAYDLAGREPLRLAEMVRQTVDAVGCRRLLLQLPLAAVLATTGIYNRLVRRPRITVEQVRRLRENKNFDYSAAKRDFGFDPRSFEAGVREEVRMIRTLSARHS
jgi:nucleoside-diphosphate-sugar epimerase